MKKKKKVKGVQFKVTINIVDGWPSEMQNAGTLGSTIKTKEFDYEITSINVGEIVAHELGHVLEDMFNVDDAMELSNVFEDAMRDTSRRNMRMDRSFNHSVPS